MKYAESSYVCPSSSFPHNHKHDMWIDSSVPVPEYLFLARVDARELDELLERALGAEPVSSQRRQRGRVS